MTLDRNRAVLIVVDVQERFRPAIAGFPELVEATETLILGTRAMGVPTVVTEQYPQGLGRTVPELERLLEDVTPIEKTTFAATGAAGFDLGGRDQVVLCGIEAHVCVYQTAAALLDQGLTVEVVEDAVSSRGAADRAVGLARIAALGGARTSVEMALFELLGDARSAGFETVQRLVKRRGASR